MNTPAQALSAERDPSLLFHVIRLGKKKFFRVSEVAEILDVGREMVRQLYLARDLEMHLMTTTSKGSQRGLFGESYDGRGREVQAERRSNIRITRRSLILYIARTAHYDLNAQEHVILLAETLRDLPNAALEAIRSECSKLLAVRAAHEAP